MSEYTTDVKDKREGESEECLDSSSSAKYMCERQKEWKTPLRGAVQGEKSEQWRSLTDQCLPHGLWRTVSVLGEWTEDVLQTLGDWH